jgi:hypothetical protein
MQFTFTPKVSVRNPRETATFILNTLRHEVAQFPAHAIPKHPLPSIMQTESQIAVLFDALAEANIPLWSLGSTPEELSELLEKAQVLRARYAVRQIRRAEDSCRMLDILDTLVSSAPSILTKVHLPSDAIENASAHCRA